ncbi:MAG: UGSC family (seleno)protein [Ramlibacter sp.]
MTLVCDGFVGQARNTALGLGLALPLAIVAGHPDVMTREELEERIVEGALPEILQGLSGVSVSAEETKEPLDDEVVFEGTFDEVQQHFLDRLWSDGLPVVPPTRERIAAFLSFTPRPPEQVLGVMLPDNRAATVRNVAVNGVMAGCRPEYMPVLVALAEAMADPAYGVEHSGNTPGGETQIFINGPIIKELGFNYEQGAARDGFQANTSIGRFWRLYLRNVAGFLPHQTDKGTFGGTWRVVIAENEDVLQQLGWPGVAQSNGAPPGNAVTATRITGYQMVVSVFGDQSEQLIPYLADALIKSSRWELVFTVGVATASYRPVLVLSPIIAKTLHKNGWTKAQVQQALFEQARVPAWLFEKYLAGWTNIVPGRRTLYDMARLGKAPKSFGQSKDPERLVPIVTAPEHIVLAVSGDPARTNCLVMPQNGMLGFPTSKPIDLPPQWTAQLRATRS